mmetsp:Transcript_16378/g.24141  ORF Transcript_16378/g.24141 Transcript_16378/m.24141 type:complete len:481 (-) Transcript_16378:84-1526(-)
MKESIKTPYRHNKDDSRVSSQTTILALAFTLGCMFSSIMIINFQVGITTIRDEGPRSSALLSSLDKSKIRRTTLPTSKLLHSFPDSQPTSVLDGQRVLAVIASYDFSQIPHLEEVLDGFHDLCVAGARVDVHIHTTTPYPVTLIDLLNTRHQCTNPSPRSGFTITISLFNPNVRLHLVDYHRPLFYEKIEEYDIFVYTEDDIRVTPHTIAAYLFETNRVKTLVGEEHASDFNVGVVRYEYNYPPYTIIDDKTRGATANVTRVYWEHSWHPPVPKSVDTVPQKKLSGKYVHMTNHHQGMFIATRDLLKAWKERTGCNFDTVRDRPGLPSKPSQPSEGTQRVWMSSQMLHGKRHCNVQQVIPIDKFGELTVLHLPNKNYRRVGRKGRIGGAKDDETKTDIDDHTKAIIGASSQLLSAMQLHVEFSKKWPKIPHLPYEGPVYMVNEGYKRVPGEVKKMLDDYEAYVLRGGVMSEDDMTKQITS